MFLAESRHCPIVSSFNQTHILFSQEKVLYFEIKSKTSLKLIDVCVLNIISCYVNNTISSKAKAKIESILNYSGLDYSLWLITDFLIYWNFIKIKVELMRDSYTEIHFRCPLSDKYLLVPKEIKMKRYGP